MAKGTIGLDIGTSAIRAAEVKGKDPVTLVRFADVPLPIGAIVAGEVADEEPIVAVLKETWKRGGFKSKRVAVAIANQNVIVRPIELPRMDEEDLRGALRYQVQEYIPISIDDALLDFIVLDEFENSDGTPMMRVLAVAAQKEMVNGFVRVLLRAGLEPVMVDLAPLAAARALVDAIPPVMGERQSEAIVDVGSGITNILVHEYGKPRLVRIVSMGGNDVTAALVAECGLSAEDAELEKSVTELLPEGEPVGPGAPTVIDRRAAIFIDSVRQSLDYYENQPGAVPLSRVSLIGGGARMRGLAARLGAALNVPVEPGKAFERVRTTGSGLSELELEQLQPIAAVAIGLALED